MPDPGETTMTKKDIFHFTAGELIEILKTMPKDLPVLVSGYESGFENLYQPEIVELKHEPDNMYYDGEFQPADEGDGNTFKAIVLMRVNRDD